MSRPKLRTIREQRGMSLAEMAKLCEVSISYLSRFERGLEGSESIQPAIAARISTAYGVRLRQSAMGKS